MNKLLLFFLLGAARASPAFIVIRLKPFCVNRLNFPENSVLLLIKSSLAPDQDEKYLYGMEL
jgi:hypothetical protein